jgi:hypothetical protein
MAHGLIVIDMMNRKGSLLFSFAAKSAGVVISLPDNLFNRLGKPLIGRVDKLVFHREFASAPSRAKSFISTLYRKVNLTTSTTCTFKFFATCYTFALRGAIFLSTWLSPKGVFANRTNLVNHPRVSRAGIRAKALILQWPAQERFTAKLTRFDLFGLLPNVSTAPGTKAPKASVNIKTICLKLNLANLASFNDGWLTLGCGNAQPRAELLTQACNFKRLPTTWAHSGGHGNSPYTSYCVPIRSLGQPV